MTITVSFWERLGTFEPDYSKRREKMFSGKTAAECMNQFNNYKYYHDLARYTVPEIINVEDSGEKP